MLGLITHRRLWLLLSAGIVAWGIYLRAYQLGAPSFWIDEAFSLESVQIKPDDDSWLWLREWFYQRMLELVVSVFA